MGQAKVLQAVTCLRPAQPRPPKADCLMTERVRVLEPVLQVWVQAEKADQGETLQSTGQALVLQGLTTRVLAQPRPPKTDWTMTERVLKVVPEPQVLVQGVKAVQVDMTQSIGQA